MSTDCRQNGLSLIELIVFIVIVSVALVGILTVFNVTAKSSADPMIRKQMLAVAEAVLEEVMLQPFTWCDPDDANASTADISADCTGGTGGANDESKLPLGPEAGETRFSPTSPFDNVSDYNGGPPISTSITGTALPTGYTASVVVAQSALNSIAATESLLITVTVTHGTDSIALEGYRARHSPNMLP